MKKVFVGLTFEVTPAREKNLIESAKLIRNAKFRGDDDLRDAIHELVCQQIDSEEDLFDSLDGISTEKSVVSDNRLRRR